MVIQSNCILIISLIKVRKDINSFLGIWKSTAAVNTTFNCVEISGLQQINCTSSESDNQVFSISGNLFELMDDSNYYGYYKDDGTIISYKSAKFFSKWERQGLFFLTYLTNIKYNCYHFAR